MQEHHYRVEVGGTPAEVWEVFWYHGPDKPMTPGVTIDIVHPGDGGGGDGLVRTCTFPVPRWLGSGGVGRSWEWVTGVEHLRCWNYDAIGTPPWSKAEGRIELTAVGDDRCRIDFTERYEAFSPWVRRLGIERRVHARISRDNEAFVRAVEGGLRFHRERKRSD